MANVLIVDDEPGFTSGIAEFLQLKSHSVSTANTLSAARDALADRLPDVLLLDLILPDGSGLEVFDTFDNHRPEKIIIITGHSGVKSMIEGIAGDGVSYMTKPIEPRDLLGMLDTVTSDNEDDVQREAAHFGELVGDSKPMQEVYEQIERVAATDSTVFIQGESGTGKELIAEALHRRSGRKGNFVAVNCGGLSGELVSSQLFGHEKGSFTGADKRHIGFFERAQDGTLFLDEITEMPIEMQTHLLRALETSRVLRVGAETEIPVNARLIAATNRDPADAIRDGSLREDLYYRLQVFPIRLPALSARNGDIALLARHFLRELNEKQQSQKAFSDEALARLEAHSWPGNVRELKHTVHRAFIMSDGNVIAISDHFDDQLIADIEGIRVGRSIADVERDLINATLEHFDGDKKAAAASLGISLKTLYNRLKEYETDASA
ncbi:MAG: sigma-54 dependent transcriptional regulator [Gammaproteobacteria bacterium]|nr:sigma-54 dependent transcriptional regulator [Gammaproteobacteria bacterium]